MAKLSLNKAAKEAGVAKSTLLEALNSGRMSAAKNDVGHWQIDPAELFRVFPKTSSLERGEPQATPRENQQKTNPVSALDVEVKMLREQIERMDSERERERAQLNDQIEALREQAERQSADHRQALAMLTDQREHVAKRPRKGWLARLAG
jgi:small-conductance mechanosensitive channel